jgi:hypothetical protein
MKRVSFRSTFIQLAIQAALSSRTQRDEDLAAVGPCLLDGNPRDFFFQNPLSEASSKASGI